MGHGDLSDLENRLTNVKYEEEYIKEALKLVNLEDYFGDIQLNEFANFLFS